MTTGNTGSHQLTNEVLQERMPLDGRSSESRRDKSSSRLKGRIRPGSSGQFVHKWLRRETGGCQRSISSAWLKASVTRISAVLKERQMPKRMGGADQEKQPASPTLHPKAKSQFERTIGSAVSVGVAI